MTALPESHNAVLRILRDSRVALHAREIAERTGIRERGVRYVIKDLVEAHGCPIVSAPGEDGGFRYVEDLVEVSVYRRKLLWLALTILRRARSFDRTGLAARLAGQLEIDLGGAA